MSNVRVSFIAALAVFVSCVAAAPTNCPGGAKEGETLDRGRTWYECKDGQLIEKGCLSEQNKRLNAGETFRNGGYVFECYKDDSGRFNSRPKGCVSEQDKEVMPNDTWQDDNYWYKCTMDGDRPKVTVEGCVDEGKRVNIEESIKKGDLIYVCKHSPNGNTGFDIYPNPDKNAVYKTKEDDHVQRIQNVPTFINTK